MPRETPLSGNRDRRLVEEAKRRFRRSVDLVANAATSDGPPPGTLPLTDPMYQLERLQRVQQSGKPLTSVEQHRLEELRGRVGGR